MLRKAAPRTAYTCRECGQVSPKWEGRCSRCGAWNALEERLVEPRGKAPSRIQVGHASAAASTAAELAAMSTPQMPRLQTGIAEIDRVFGGGIVGGSVSLVAGDPGIGKSTLLLQLSDAVARTGGRVVYVCGEESAEQVRLRAARLGIAGRNLFLLATGQVEAVLAELEGSSPAIVIVDSIQTMTTSQLDSIAGTMSQIQASTHLLTEQAKARNVPVVMTGHVTKDGVIAGPRLLEHAVDVVLYLEGDAGSGLRLLRGVKNRFGPTDEVGVFEMRSDGMSEVPDPSRAFLGARNEATPGSALATVIEGTRAFTIEVQALTTPSMLPAPRRLATGIDPARLALVAAVLTRRLGLPLGSQDVIVNVPGGLRLREPAADLAMALAIVSSLRDGPVRAATTAAAEVGLGGELRPVGQAGRRVAEASRLGISHCIGAAGADTHGDPAWVGVRSLAEAVDFAMPKRLA
ncbi:MAG: DNA repair protein RadA [Chloroflexi bacterium]|nr:DNA repair protein RadA [Chloroflexota bacterium]